MSVLPDLRAPLEGSTPGGARVRLRPAVAAGRWICDVWGPDGTLVFGGRPLAAGADLLSIAALGEGPWCLTVLRDGLPEDAVCVPEDVPGADPGTGLLLVRQGDEWIAALPGPSASCAPELGGEGG